MSLKDGKLCLVQESHLSAEELCLLLPRRARERKSCVFLSKYVNPVRVERRTERARFHKMRV